MASPDVRSLCPPAAARSIHNVLPFKLALVEQHGIERGFEIYRSMLGIPASYRLVRKRLQPLRDFARRHGEAFEEIYPAGEAFTVPLPSIVGANDARTMSGVSRSFYVTLLADVVVHPHSALVQAGDAVLADYESGELTAFDDKVALDPLVFHAAAEDVWLIAGEPVVDATGLSSAIGTDSPYHGSGPMRDLVASGKGTFEVEEAFGSLIGPHSPHFGHWLWEYLPKYLTAIASGKLPPVPILVNPAMPPTLWEALRLLASPDVELVELPFAPVRVRRLWYAPALMHEPWFEDPNERYPGMDHRCFPAERFMPTLKAMGKAADAVSVARPLGERVFLARKGALWRKLINHSEIEVVAASRGFDVVSPEELSFAEQIAMAHGAHFLAGPEGSQIYLSFFARPQTKLCVLNHPFTQDLLNFCYLVERNGVAVTIFTGPPCVPADDPRFELGAASLRRLSHRRRCLCAIPGFLGCTGCGVLTGRV